MEAPSEYMLDMMANMSLYEIKMPLFNLTTLKKLTLIAFLEIHIMIIKKQSNQ